MENYNTDKLSSIDLQIDEEVKQQLTETSKWTKFISISMFILCGIILIAVSVGGRTLMLFLSKVNSPLIALLGYSGGILITIIAVIMIGVAVVYYFLYRFSAKIKMAIATENTLVFNEAFSSLKIFFIITAIVSIITLLGSLTSIFKMF
jgi:hypothetical protein